MKHHETFTCLWILIKRLKLFKKAHFEGIDLLSKAESESLAEVCSLWLTVVISLADQIILNKSNKDYDWPILACFIREQKKDMVWKFSECLGKCLDSSSQNKERSLNWALFCCRALMKWGKTLDCISCFPLHFFPALLLPACFTTEQSTVEASLFVNFHVAKLHPDHLCDFRTMYSVVFSHKCVQLPAFLCYFHCLMS